MSMQVNFSAKTKINRVVYVKEKKMCEVWKVAVTGYSFFSSENTQFILQNIHKNWEN